MIPFNKPYLTGKELSYIEESIRSGKISGNGVFTRKCQEFFAEKLGFKKCLLTTSCTDALEMAAILCEIKPGDEVIVPSYTFVSTANAFVLRGAKTVFADSRPDHPGIDETKIESLISLKTKVIVPVHYAGVACDMDKIMELADRHNLLVVEDAAQAIDSYFYSQKEGKKKVLGQIGHLGCFSFHETKNLQCGEGGMLAINDDRFSRRAEIIWEKGTNRSEFFRGEVNKYGWKDIGSSFLPSELNAAFLFAQLENLNNIQVAREKICEAYYVGLRTLEVQGKIRLPFIPDYATNNWHMFYIICNSFEERNDLISHLYKDGILSVFHYLSLHKSEFMKYEKDNRELPYSDFYQDHLLRLPLFVDLTEEETGKVIEKIIRFFQ
jgi:dTDP-4-amino-4,6-dideoxygalactose transaminase